MQKNLTGLNRLPIPQLFTFPKLTNAKFPFHQERLKSDIENEYEAINKLHFLTTHEMIGVYRNMHIKECVCPLKLNDSVIC